MTEQRPGISGPDGNHSATGAVGDQQEQAPGQHPAPGTVRFAPGALPSNNPEPASATAPEVIAPSDVSDTGAPQYPAFDPQFGNHPAGPDSIGSVGIGSPAAYPGIPVSSEPGPAFQKLSWQQQAEPHWAAPNAPYAAAGPYQIPASPYDQAARSGAMTAQPPYSGAPYQQQGVDVTPNAGASGYAPAQQYAYPPQQAPTGSPVLGILAFVASVLAAAGSTIMGVIATVEIARYLGSDSGRSVVYADDLSFLSPVRGSVLLAEVSFYVGTALGVIAIVLAIIAIAKRLGRGWAISGLVIAVIAPIVYLSVLAFAFPLGIIDTAF